MAFRLEHHEPMVEGIGRIAREVIRESIALLGDSTIDPGRRVHDVRTGMKRVRALLRMIRCEIGDDLFRRDDHHFRSVAHSLAPNRDRAVLADTIARLRQSDPAIFDNVSIFDVWQRVGADESGRPVSSDDLFDSAVALLREGEGYLDQWLVGRNDFRGVQKGINRVYRRGRLLCARVRSDPTPERIHDWRRQVKYLWYIMTVLSPIWPRVMSALAAEYRSLSALLGDDHDLYLLHTKLAADESLFAPLVRTIDLRRSAILKLAGKSGEHLFADAPRRHVRRLAHYWRLWNESFVELK